MKTLLANLFLLLILNLTFTQTDKIPIKSFKTTPGNDMKTNNDLVLLNQVNFFKLDTINKALYYLNKSSFHLFLNLDSSVLFLEKAFKMNSQLVCNIITASELAFNSPERKIKDWYITLLPNFDEYKFLENCHLNYPNKNLKIKKRDSTFIEKIIMDRDQRYRGKEIDNWKLQDSLDKLNRIYIDSLYTLNNERLISFSNEELRAFSFAIHHSSDCDWNKKWFNIWLKENVKKPDLYIGLVYEAMLRFFNKTNGFCRNTNVETDEYIEELKVKYGNELASKYGYDKF